jgi:hypothetical protein
VADDDRPQYQHGIGTIDGTQFHWGSGTPGKYWSIPYGDYPVTPNAPTGAWAHQAGAIPINNNVIPDPQLGRNRIGIMIHSGSAPSLDQLYTEGCFKVDPQDWPTVRSQILAEADKGPLYLHVAPGGVAAFTNTKTFSQAGEETPAANANAAANTTAAPSRVASATPIPGGNAHSDFIVNYAKQIGLDPNLALGIANAEGLRAWSSSNPNAASTVDVENGKPFSFGDYQLNTHPGALGAKAIAAGIDPTDPSQWQAADKFALDQMKAGGVGPWSGDPVAKAYQQTGSVPGMTLTNAPVSTAPGNASAGASGSPASAAATTAVGALGTPGGPALPGFSQAQSNQFLQGASGLQKAMGGQGLQGQQGGDGGQEQMRPSPMLQGPAPHIPNAQAAAQTYGQTLNSMRTPLQWGSGTPGSSISATAGPQVAPGVPQGMTAQELQQMQQLQMMQMMGGGMGTTLSSPYGGGYG